MIVPHLSEVIRLASHSFACYALAQRRDLQISPFHHIVIDELEALERGDNLRTMLLMPPRHGKSLLCTEIFPAWFMGRHPDRSIITVTYGQGLSDDFGRKVRNLITSPVHRLIFPNCQLADARSVRRFTTTAGGSYYAVGRGGPITGRGAHLLLLDDVLKGSEEARSQVIRQRLHDWFAEDAYTRLQPGGVAINLQTTWHKDDLAGRLLREHGSEWHPVILRAIAEQDESFRRNGEALWPERFPLGQLLKIQANIGSKAFGSLYQQRPTADEGTVFKKIWWRYYDGKYGTDDFFRVVYSWDTAYKTGSQNDFSVCTVWGQTRAPFRYYLLGFWRGRVEFPELKRNVIAMAERGPHPSAILVEDEANGQSLIQALKYSTALPITAIRVDRDKLTRAQAATPVIEAGQVFLPDNTPYLQTFLDEMSQFPVGVHDDIVDSTVQALNYLRLTPHHTVGIYPQLI